MRTNEGPRSFAESVAKARRSEFHPLPGGVDRSGDVELFGFTGVQCFQYLVALQIDQVGVGQPGFLKRLPTDMLRVVASLRPPPLFPWPHIRVRTEERRGGKRRDHT